MPTPTPTEVLLTRLQRKNHPAWSRQLWDRKGRTAISIPTTVVKVDDIEIGHHIGLVITSEGKLYLQTMQPSPENRTALVDILGPCFIIPTQTKALGSTMFISFPDNVIGLKYLAPGDPVTIVFTQKHLYRLLTIDELEANCG